MIGFGAGFARAETLLIFLKYPFVLKQKNQKFKTGIFY